MNNSVKFSLILFLIPVTYAFGDSDFSQSDLSKEEYQPGIDNPKIIFHDLSKLGFEVIEVNQFFIPKWINEPGDFSDILQVKFNVTNNGLEHFVVYKNMFRIDVLDPKEQYQEVRRTNQDYLVDNYYPQYIEDFKLRFQDITLPQSIFECELLNHDLKVNQTKTLSVCFDVKQKWTNYPLDLNGHILYYLVMMDNKFVTSCPNCKSVFLNEYYNNPIPELKISDYKIPKNHLQWLDTLVIWSENFIISEKEFSNAIDFLLKRRIIENRLNENKEILFENKFKKESILTMVDFRSIIFNEGQSVMFQGRLTDDLRNPISNVPILIKSDGPCPTNHIIAEGLTGKNGRYAIVIQTLLWDEEDGLVTTFAEFSGTESFEKSVSDPQWIVVYPVKGEKCFG